MALSLRRLRELPDEAEASARSRPAAAGAAIFLWAAALRLAVCVLTARAAGVPPRGLALFFDGHLYLWIARSFPAPYQGASVPFLGGPRFLAGWMPLHPLAIYLLRFLVRDWLAAALAASQLAGAAAVALFFALARQARAPRPFACAALFAVWPATWLLCGSLDFVEPMFSAAVIAAFLFFLRRRHLAAAACACAAALAQKTGLLIPPLLLALALADERRGRAASAYLLAFAPVAALQAYFGRVFRDPLAALHAQQAVWSRPIFTYPLHAMLSGLAHASPPYWDVGLRNGLIACSLFFYAGAWAAGWLERREESRPFLAWLGLFLVFNLSLTGDAGYIAFPRYMTVAAPAAWLLLSRRLPAASLYAALLSVPLVAAVAAHEGLVGAAVTIQSWPAGYFAWLSRTVFGN